MSFENILTTLCISLINIFIPVVNKLKEFPSGYILNPVVGVSLHIL